MIKGTQRLKVINLLSQGIKPQMVAEETGVDVTEVYTINRTRAKKEKKAQGKGSPIKIATTSRKKVAAPIDVSDIADDANSIEGDDIDFIGRLIQGADKSIIYRKGFIITIKKEN